MKIFLRLALILLVSISISNCSTDDSSTEPTPLRDFTVQYTADNTAIETYLKTHKYTQVGDYDVVFTKSTNQTDSMWGAGATHSPTILERECYANGVKYTIYYIKLRQGGQSSATVTKKPCNLDAVLTAYKGRLMDEFENNPVVGGASDLGTVFDFNNYPQSYFNLDQVIRGWSEILPLFNAGTHVTNADGSTTFSDFGAGIIFIPSGLAYYNGSTGTIPAYTPLIFNFKLYEVRRNDHDGDGIEDYDENIDIHTGTTGNLEEFAAALNTSASGRYTYANAANSSTGVVTDDTDGDGRSDAYDQDDDGDFYLTRSELKKPGNSSTGYYTFSDNYKCGGSSTLLLRNYLDKTCHN